MDLARRIICCALFAGPGAVLIAALMTDVWFRGRHLRNGWPALFGLSLLSIGVVLLVVE